MFNSTDHYEIKLILNPVLPNLAASLYPYID